MDSLQDSGMNSGEAEKNNSQLQGSYSQGWGNKPTVVTPKFNTHCGLKLSGL